ncbi:MAG: hypothetical protein WC659_04150 [Patescibacteria group bacterium]
MFLNILLAANQRMILASEGIASVSKDDEKIVSFFAMASSPYAATIILGIFVILVVAVAYVLVGIILFTLFAYR